MHLRPDTDLWVGDFDYFVSSMSGMPEEQHPNSNGATGFHNNSNDDNHRNEDDSSGGAFGGWMSSYNMGYEDKANPLKRSSAEEDYLPSNFTSNKRMKSADSTGHMQEGTGGAGQSLQGMDGNILSAELQRVAAFAHQQMDFSSINNLDIDLNSNAGGHAGLGAFGGLGSTGRPMDPESSNRQQQPNSAAMLSNDEMAMINHTSNLNQQLLRGNSFNQAFGGASSQRQQQQQQQLFGNSNNGELFGQSSGGGSMNHMPPGSSLQNLQGLSYQLVSNMNGQPFLSNMLEMSRQSLFNNEGRPQLISSSSNSFNTPFMMNQQMNMTSNSQTNQNTFGQVQGSSFLHSNTTNRVSATSADIMPSLPQNGAPTADAAPSLGPMHMLQMNGMNGAAPSSPHHQQQLSGMNAAASSASLQQQQQVFASPQQSSRPQVFSSPQQSSRQQVYASPQQSNRSVIATNDANNGTFGQLAPPLGHQRQPIRMLPMDTCQPVLPPIEEANTPHYSQRPFHPFSVEEDPNWLSELQCFIRSEILELFRVSQQGIKIRNALKSLKVNQVGIRCRYCAHLQHGTRANRASCFPSKIEKIYQSFTMMLREHIPSCSEIPPALKQRFLQLQNMNAQGASNAKGFWEHAARKKGMVDTTAEEGGGRGGIHIFEASLAQAATIIPFGAETNYKEPQPPITLVRPNDKELVSNFLYTLMGQVNRVHLTSSERKGNRKSLKLGMPGFGCRYCYDAGRMGLCRLFPARRRTIHTKIPDLYDHMRRCPLCPQQVKDNLIRLHDEDNGGSLTQSSADLDTATRGREREFFERIWARLGHEDETEK